MKKIEALLASNHEWAESLKAEDPDFFARLSEAQNPDFLWIGCSDSRISPTSSVGLLPGEMFVHRNVANVVNHSDMNCLAVMQFAVEVLKVRHIIVCGHYACGGVKAVLDNARYGLVDNWLRAIHDIKHKYAEHLNSLPSYETRLDKLCEVNVIEQVISVGETTVVRDAWHRGQELFIHGWIYTIADGIYRDMKMTVNSLEALDALRLKTIEDSHAIGAKHAN